MSTPAGAGAAGRAGPETARAGPPRLGPQLRETLSRITEEAARLLAVEGAGLRLVDGDELIRVATYGPDGAVMVRERLRLGQSLSGRVAALGQPLILDEPEADPTHDPIYRARAQQHGFRSWLGVPLRDGGRVIGVLVMQSRTEHRFGPADVQLLEAFAGQAAIAIENARLYERERERRRQLEAVREVTARLASETDLAPLLALISRLAAELLGVASVAVYLWDDATGTLLPRAWHGFDDWLGELRIRPGEGLAGTVALRRAGLIVDDYRQLPVPQPTFLARQGQSAVIGEPLLYEGELRGVITAAIHEGTRTFEEQDRELLSLFAAQAAIAIEQARLHEARDRALAEAQAALRARDEFLSIAAHELKTPITGLLGYAQLAVAQVARGHGLDTGLGRKALRAIEQQSVKLGRLVEQLLDIARIESGRLAIEPVLTDLVPLVEEAIEAARLRTERHTIALQAPPVAFAQIDGLRLEQVLTNLLDNAIKYSPDGGPIEVELSSPAADRLRLTVTDRGLGIPPEQRERVFDRFFQIHADSHRSGMGLGLYICRQIVELHGGQIEAELPPGGGTRLAISLPAAPDEMLDPSGEDQDE